MSRHARAIVPVALSVVVMVLSSGNLFRPAAAQQPQPTPPRTAASPFQPPEPIAYDEHDGWTAIFDGRTLDGWSGNPAVWSVDDGTITAESTAARRIGSTHLIWQGGELSDFELKVEMKLEGDIHSGIAYRSRVDDTPPRPATATQASGRGPSLAVPVDPRWTLLGPGLDFDADLAMAGNIEDRGTPRREVAWRGGIVRARAGERPRLVGTLGDPDALKAQVDPAGWNRIHVIASGRQLTHIINGTLMAVLLDEDPQYFRASGLIGLQIEQWGAGRVRFRNVWIRRIPA